MTDVQKASTVWPESVLPLKSVIVPEIIRGNSIFFALKIFFTATIAAFAFSVSNMVSIRIMSEPPSINPLTCSSYASLISSKEVSLNPGSSTFGEIDNVLFVGPKAPATNLGLSSVEYFLHACLASFAAILFSSKQCSSVL